MWQVCRVRTSAPQRLRSHAGFGEERMSADTSPFQETIDKTLRLVYSQMHRYHVKLFGKAPDAVSVEGLREGPLGRDLYRLGRLARGEEQADQEEVFRAVTSILELLFWPAGEDQYQVPRSFW